MHTLEATFIYFIYKKKVNKESSLSWTDAMWVIKISTPGCYGSLKIWDQQKHIRWCCKIVVSRMCEYYCFFSGFWSFCSLSSVPGLQGFLHNDAWAEENLNRPFPLKIISLIEFCGTPKKYIKKMQHLDPGTWSIRDEFNWIHIMNSEPWKSCSQFPESFTIGESEDFVEAHTWAQGLYLQFPRPGIKEVRCITTNKKFIPSKMFQTLQMYFSKKSPMSAWDPRHRKKYLGIRGRPPRPQDSRNFTRIPGSQL